MAKGNHGIIIEARDIVGKRVLILGETGSGKTLLASRLLNGISILVDPREITVIDMGPERTGEVGGRLVEYTQLMNNLRYLRPRNVYTPRLSGNSVKHVLNYTELNRQMI